MHFNRYLKEASEKTLKSLINNFKKVHPYSNTNLDISSIKIKPIGLTLLCSAICKSEDEKRQYQVYIQLHKKKLTDKFTVNNIAEVKCTCKAFRFYDAYPNVLNKSFYSKPTSFNRIRNKIRNKQLIPTTCKHLYAFIKYLISQHIIELQ